VGLGLLVCQRTAGATASIDLCWKGSDQEILESVSRVGNWRRPLQAKDAASAKRYDGASTVDLEPKRTALGVAGYYSLHLAALTPRSGRVALLFAAKAEP